jgi:hypothetical protein
MDSALEHIWKVTCRSFITGEETIKTCERCNLEWYCRVLDENSVQLCESVLAERVARRLIPGNEQNRFQP